MAIHSLRYWILQETESNKTDVEEQREWQNRIKHRI